MEEFEPGASGIGETGTVAFACPHDHVFLSSSQRSNERRTWWVVGLTTATMGVEIASGLAFGSMALLADGWHMASHASALGVTALAYYLSRKYRDDPRFAFGTGKIGDLAGFGSALLLWLIAVLMAYESIQRLFSPVSIRFGEAIAVAVVGLAVNLVSAAILKEHGHAHDHDHDHDYEHEHEHEHDEYDEHDHGEDEDHGHRDHNLRAAYLHVLADALTSILAIAGLGLGMLLGWSFLDPLMGIVGAALISRWSYGLMKETANVLLDRTCNPGLARRIAEILSDLDGVRILDLHAWRLGPGHFGAIVSVAAPGCPSPDFFKERLRGIEGLSHLTVEVNPSEGHPEKTTEPAK